MSELNRSWFSNARSLPLNADGKVDFSLEKEEETIFSENDFNPKNGERFRGWLFYSVPMPDEGRVITLYKWDSDDPALSLYDMNHNVFRLGKNNEIIWQVHRDERGCVNWESCNKHAKLENPESEGCKDPFYGMSDKFFEERPQLNKKILAPDVEQVWFDTYAPGRLLYLETGWYGYHLDPETGIAVCTGRQVR